MRCTSTPSMRAFRFARRARRRIAAAARFTSLALASPSSTRPASVLCGKSGEATLSATGRRRVRAARAASAGDAASASGTSGSPKPRSSALPASGESTPVAPSIAARADAGTRARGMRRTRALRRRSLYTSQCRIAAKQFRKLRNSGQPDRTIASKPGSSVLGEFQVTTIGFAVPRAASASRSRASSSVIGDSAPVMPTTIRSMFGSSAIRSSSFWRTSGGFEVMNTAPLSIGLSTVR